MCIYQKVEQTDSFDHYLIMTAKVVHTLLIDLLKLDEINVSFIRKTQADIHQVSFVFYLWLIHSCVTDSCVACVVFVGF